MTVVNVARPSSVVGATDVHAASVAAGATTDQPTNTGTGGEESVMWQASDDSSAGDRVEHHVGDRRRRRHQLPDHRSGIATTTP